MMAYGRRGIARRWALLSTLSAALVIAWTTSLRSEDTDLRPDFRPPAYAIKGASVVTGAGTTIENGTVVVRDGVIESVGPADQVNVPVDAEVIEGKDLVVYPGFVDLYATLGVPHSTERSETGPGRSVPHSEFALPSTPMDNRLGLTPEYQVAEDLNVPEKAASDRRKLGFTDLLAAPGGAIATGQSALASLSGLPRREVLVSSPVALHITLERPSEPPSSGGADGENPEVRRRFGGGGIRYPNALMGVIAHLRQAMLDSVYNHAAWDYFEAHGGARPALDPALKALYQARTKHLPVWWEANTRDEILRAIDLADEFGTGIVIVGGREADRVVEVLKERDIPVILRLNAPEEPKVPKLEDYRKLATEKRLEPYRVQEHRKAKWAERASVAGVLAKAGVRFAFATDGIDKLENVPSQLKTLMDHGLERDAALKGLTSQAAEIAGVDSQLGTLSPGKLGHLVVMTAPLGDDKAKAKYVLVDGLRFDFEEKSGDRPTEGRGGHPEEAKSKADSDEKDDKPDAEEKKADEKKEPAKDEAKPAQEKPFVDLPSELDVDRQPTLKTGGNVLVKNARILTVTPKGTIERGSILVQDGKIAKIGTDLEVPEGITVIDASGLVVMPGIIDTHSHMAISGGVNEMSLSIVPEVRVADVVDGEDPTIYRALAGGTTAARLLHGSANAIGGQDVVIKLRFGRAGRDLILRDSKRPQGVKFALGENVIRVSTRFPNTRMGVEATIERAFLEGRAYAKKRKAYAEAVSLGKSVPPFRRDLRLEALAAVLEGSIKIHSHCYRSDEILMLLRLCERFGVRVQSLQHVLEGYKVAAEIAAHGASASTFSDWWAYKIEAFDAIPQNAALLTEAGARVCIKSDDEELVRHLYLEAAKMVKYGNVTEQKALEMITLNPARELGLEHRLGSIEVGKDADLAIFNGHPFDTFARCEMSLVDGEVAFQRREPDGKMDTLAGDGSMPSATDEARMREVALPEHPNGPYAVVGARIHPVTGPVIEQGTVVVANGRIAAVGGPDTPVPAGAETIDAHGLDLWPGMVDAGAILGLFEIGSLSETQDHHESATFQPELRSSVAIHPDSTIIPVTRANGILSAYVQPSGGIIAGQGSLIDLAGWVPSEMTRVPEVALNINIPRFIPVNPDGHRPDGDPNRARREQLDEIEDFFRLALEYDKILTAAKAGTVRAPSPDPRLTALVPYAKGEKPVIFVAESAEEILDALELAETLKLKAILSGGREAWKVIDELKAAKVPVILAGSLRLPASSTALYDSSYTTAARLSEAGIPFAIRSGGRGPDQATSARNLPYEAAMSVAYGLSEDEALKAVSLYPAKILGVDANLGSIEVGKTANLVLSAGHLLQATTPVRALIIRGQPMPPRNKQTELYAKYRERLHEVKAGQAPLGLVREKPTPETPASTGETRSAPASSGGAERR